MYMCMDFILLKIYNTIHLGTTCWYPSFIYLSVENVCLGVAQALRFMCTLDLEFAIVHFLEHVRTCVRFTAEYSPNS